MFIVERPQRHEKEARKKTMYCKLKECSVEGGRASRLALGIILDKPKPDEPMKEKGEDQRGLKKRSGETDGGGIEVQAIFTAVKVDAKQVAAPGEEKYDDGSSGRTVV